MSDGTPALIADRLTDGLRRGILSIPAVLLGLDTATILGDDTDYQPYWWELLAFGMLALTTAAAAVPVIRRRPWGRWRWPLLAATLAGSALSTAAVRPEDLARWPHWSLGVFGWWAVLFLLDRPMRNTAAAVATYYAMTVAQLAVADRADPHTLIGIGVTGCFNVGLQLSAWLVGAATRQVAASAARAATDAERLRTADALAERLHLDRQNRYTELADTAAPLLAGLATGDLDPGDPTVRHACLIEATRLRRLFAEHDETGDPLLHELAACTDLATRRGVIVEVATRGDCPAVPLQVRRALTEPVLRTLAAAMSTARITVVAMPDRVIISTVADTDASADAVTDTGATTDPVTVRVTAHATLTWVEAIWRHPATPAESETATR